jgi:hypothetical protein
MPVVQLVRIQKRILETLSFSPELRRLRRELNERIDAPQRIDDDPESHPRGITRWYKHRRISIAEAYVRVVRDLDSRHAKERLRALGRIMELSFHAKTLDLPLNTARVQLALVKEAIKHRDDRRRQLELLHDFSESSHGQYQVIRRLLDELDLVELPERGLPLSELDAGFDGDVHDSSTSGRKNATQLLIDAFIKGISELTLACGGPSALEQIEEAIEAGRITGIRVRLGIEFSLTRCERRFHFMAILPVMKRGTEAGRFFRDNRKLLKELVEGLEENQEIRVGSIRSLLSNFNDNYLDSINEGFPKDRRYRLSRLRMKDLSRFVPLSRVTRDHLGDFLHPEMERILRNRVLRLKVESARARIEAGRGRMPEKEFRAIEARYLGLRAEYAALSPERLRQRYFESSQVSDYGTVFGDLERMSGLLRQAGCRLRLLHPLEHGLEKAREFLALSAPFLDEIEVYNIQESLRRDPSDILAFCKDVYDFNRMAGDAPSHGIVPISGSDARGRDPGMPGMGFIFADRIGDIRSLARAARSRARGHSTSLPGRSAQRYARRHVPLPELVGRLIRGTDKPMGLDRMPPAPALFSMGRISAARPNRIGDEREEKSGLIPLRRAYRYLNPVLLNIARPLIGFLVARQFIGDGYALLWLGITGFRNSLADIVAARGASLREWTVRSVNFDNVAKSLFWTGFSVPILGFVKANFDSFWPFATVGLGYNAVKFFFISGTNGLYIASHNWLRGFDRGVIRANLFRSVISWPFATVFAPLGNLLGIPSIVQSKIWSDLVAGFIEGGNKYLKIKRLLARDLEEIVPKLGAEAREERLPALLDLLFLWREEPRTRSSLDAFLRHSDPGPLRALLMDEMIERRLVDFIIKEYPRQMAANLASLIAETLPGFKEWFAARP